MTLRVSRDSGRTHSPETIATNDPPSRSRFYLRTLRAVPRARDFTRVALVDWRVDSRTDEIVQCVRELAANAVRHGAPPGRGFLLKLVHDGPVIRAEVHDSGEPMPHLPRTGASTDATTGRGLLLVAALSDAWGVRERNPGKAVWTEFHR
ncbi:ATP-binding protein [Streptomyces sp. NPDC099050]|uniref:ATP-binding protein n=1 Tax=Streptomyces sp. NPDC099050 TaxID=3366100 RepID=UPI0038026918